MTFRLKSSNSIILHYTIISEIGISDSEDAGFAGLELTGLIKRHK